MKKQRLIILTTEPENFVPKELSTEGEKAGLEIEIINPVNCYISLGVGNDTYISHEGTKFLGADFCIPRLSEDNLEYKIAIIEHLENMGIKCLNSGSAMRNCSNKVLTQILLAKNDFKTPKTTVVTSDEQLEFAVKAMGDKFPVIIKTLFGTHGVGIIRADSAPSLKSIVQQLLKSDIEFLLQEFIEHDESARVYVLGGEILAAVMRDIPKGDFRSNAHQGAKLKEHKLSDNEKEICLSAAKTVGAHFAAVDYIIVGDDIIVLEVNGSPGFESLQKIIDDNIAAKIIKWIMKNEDSLEDDEEPVENNKSDHEEPVKDDKPVIGTIEKIIIKYVNDNNPISARIDTGATHSSLHADSIEILGDMVKFRFGDYTYKFPTHRTSRVKTPNNEIKEWDRRPVIKVDIIIDEKTITDVELTLSDRGNMKYDLLIGRSTLIAGGFLVDPSDNDEKPIEKSYNASPEPAETIKSSEEE